MESPEFPLPPGQYMVTGGRDVRTVLSVYPKDAQGRQRWELADGATVYDVTHLALPLGALHAGGRRHELLSGQSSAQRIPSIARRRDAARRKL